MEAYLYRKLDDARVRCDLCAHGCKIKAGDRGICGVRRNDGGRLETLVYGKLIARNADPIEKKPLFHFYPGSQSYSIATVGCNFKCRFCQNADIAQMPNDREGVIAGQVATPKEVVADAMAQNCRSIAYTYTEPTIFFEFALDTARIAHGKGIKNVFVTNGYMSAAALDMVAPCLDAANVDLKAFGNDFYKQRCSARLDPVKATLRRMKRLGIHLEVTTLLIPGLNDDADELGRLADFIAADLGPETPWHVSRFHPTYRLTDRPPTPVRTLESARNIGMAAGLRYVYTGNVPGREGEKTFCFHCGRVVIDRWAFTISHYLVDDGHCRHCGAAMDGVGL
jgi:pyruvate formate lyase activating enzyme